MTCHPMQARLFDEPQLASLCLENIDKNTADAIAAEGFTDIDRGEASGGGPAVLRRSGHAPAPAQGVCVHGLAGHRLLPGPRDPAAVGDGPGDRCSPELARPPSPARAEAVRAVR